MSFSQLIPLTAAIINLALTIFVMTRGLRTMAGRVYLLWGLALTVWNFGTFMMFQLPDAAPKTEVLFWARFLQFGVIFLPITLTHLCLLVGHFRVPTVIYAGYALDLFLAGTNFTPWFIKDVDYLGYAWYCKAGPGFWILVCTYTIPALTLVSLSRKRLSLPPQHRRRLTNMIGAIAALIIFGFNDSLPILGVDKYPIIGAEIFPFGSAAAILYGIVVSYSVLQHHLLDIHVTLTQMAARVVRLLFLFLIGFSLLLLLAYFEKNDLGKSQFTTMTFVSALAVLLVSAIIASIFFPRVFGGGDEALERRILGDRFEYHEKVLSLIQTLRSLPEPHFVLDELEQLLVHTMRVQSYEIILLNDMSRSFTMYHAYPRQLLSPLPDLHLDSPAFKYFQSGAHPFLTCNPAYETSVETRLEYEARHQLAPLQPEFCFPFYAGRDLVGLLLLGPKTSGDLFTPHDLRLLCDLAMHLGFVLNQVRLRQQLQVAFEQDLLGRMSRGLAHDLNNLLTPVQTLLQLFQESAVNRSAIVELLPVALSNLTTVRSYVNEALFFSRTAKPQVRAGSLDQTVREAVPLVRNAAESKGVELFFEGMPETVVEMDSTLIKRLVCNLLSNAIDASPVGSRVEIRVSPLSRTEKGRDWHRLLVIDHGSGISPENLQRVFTPYFTTKNTGDGKRGFGLGLAIARKIVHLHGGNLSITSEEKKGTTVQVDLPSRVSPQPAQSSAESALEEAAA